MKKLVRESLYEELDIEKRQVFKKQKNYGITAKDVDPKELLVGLEVEKEHSDSLAVAETIALQHLAENPKYYSEGMKKGMFDEPAAMNVYKKYFINRDEVSENLYTKKRRNKNEKTG